MKQIVHSILIAGFLCSCSSGGGEDPPAVTTEDDPVTFCHTAQDSEPNNDCSTPQSFGSIGVGCSYQINGFVDIATDPFDGFSIAVPEPMQVDISLSWSAPADLQLAGYTFDSCQQFICSCTANNPETFTLIVDQPGSGFQLVVAALGGNTGYELTLTTSPIGSSPDPVDAYGVGAPALLQPNATFAGYEGGAPFRGLSARPSVIGSGLLLDDRGGLHSAVLVRHEGGLAIEVADPE